MQIKITHHDPYGYSPTKAIDIDNNKDALHLLHKPFEGFVEGFKDVTLFVPVVIELRGGHGEGPGKVLTFKLINTKTLECVNFGLKEGMVIEIYKIAP